ncbi:MAG: hypothetical protein QXO30_04625 [Candidatus Caldarchaeum sp.]
MKASSHVATTCMDHEARLPSLPPPYIHLSAAEKTSATPGALWLERC